MLELDTVHCGDAVEWLKTLPEGCVDAVVTDPPYGQLGYAWDIEPEWEKLGMEFVRALTPNGSCAIWGSARTLYRSCVPALEKCGLVYRFEWVTVKPIGRLWSYKRPIRLHEFVVVLRKGKEGDTYSDLRAFGKQPNSVVNVLCYQSYMRKHKDATGHPTQKDLSFVRPVVAALAPPGGVILDCFAGSGTTCEAALLEGRHFLACDIDPGYCEIARKRIAEAKRALQPQLMEDPGA